jgi:hypothetical protein
MEYSELQGVRCGGTRSFVNQLWKYRQLEDGIVKIGTDSEDMPLTNIVQ